MTLKSIQPGYTILLKTLITKHHQLYLKLFNTNPKPKTLSFVHYPYIMRKVGPVSHLWSRGFESKHRESKLLRTLLPKNICYILSIEHQLKLAYRLLSLSLDIRIKIDLTETIIENIKLEISDPVIKFNVVCFERHSIFN